MKVYLIALSVLLHLNSYSQSLSSIEYSSEFEKSVFDSLSNENINYTRLYAAATTNANEQLYVKITVELNSLYRFLDSKKIEKLEEKKKIDLIFESVHDRYFKKFEEIATFGEIFQTGNFNCVTGSALFSIVFDHYKIPYQIKELPTHVYLIAYPESFKFWVESTLPGTQFITATEASQKETVIQLVQLKLLRQESVDSLGYSKSYYNYFYKYDKVITSITIAGIQYYNLAIKAFERGEFEKCIQLINKANYFDHSDRNKYLKILALSNILDNSNFTNTKEIDHLVEYASLVKTVESSKYILRSFLLITQKSLIEEQDTTFLNYTYRALTNNIDNQDLKKDININYYLNLSKFYALKGDWDNVINHAKFAYALNPQNLEIQNLIMRSAGLNIANSRSLKTSATIATKYIEDFPFLNSNNLFLGAYVELISQYSADLFRNNKESEGLMYLKKAEQILLTNKEIVLNKYHLESMFLSAINYYQHINSPKYKTIVDRGLKILPDSRTIKQWK